MTATYVEDDNELPRYVRSAVAKLVERLPEGWSCELVATPADAGVDAELRLAMPINGSTQFLIEMVDDLRPRDVAVRFASGLTRRLRAVAAYQPLLVVAPSLSLQTRAALKAEKVSYLDALGNAWVTSQNTGLLIDIESGAATTAARAAPGQRNLAGAAVGGVVRALADGRPPATLGDLARVAGISLGYCSRVVGILEDELLVERLRRGGVASVDWAEMLRRRGEVTRLFRGATSYVARQGVPATIDQLRNDPPDGAWCITGSHAAARYAPVTAPAGLTMWAAEPGVLTERLRLLPVDDGGDVRLITPTTSTVFDRMDDDAGGWWERPAGVPLHGARWAAPTQVVVDCLAGTGRMPEEGEALLTWLQDTEDRWRTRPIAALDPGRDER